MENLYVELGGVVKGYFRRNIIFKYADAEKETKNFRTLCSNRDVYYCTYVFDNKKRDEETKLCSPLYFDIDGDMKTHEGFEAVRIAAVSLIVFLTEDLGISSSSIKTYFSGSKGFHIFIPQSVLCIPAHRHLNNIYKAFVMSIRKNVERGDLIDTKIYDSKRLIRFPNSINAKTGLYKIPLSIQQIRNIRREDLIELAKKPQAEYLTDKKENPAAARKFREIIKQACSARMRTRHASYEIPDEEKNLPICMKILMGSGTDQGGRNNLAALIASILIQNGYDRKVLPIMLSWNEMNNPPLPDREIEAVIRSAEHMVRQGKRYGCTSIRELGVFNPSVVCTRCRIFQKMRTH